MYKDIIEGVGCDKVQINSKVNISISAISRSPTYIMDVNVPNSIVYDFDDGIKIVVDKSNTIKQINFNRLSKYLFHNKIIPGETKLVDIKLHHWSFEHMYHGIITSEFYKGVGFSLDMTMKNYFLHRAECTSINDLINDYDCKIGEIVVFSNLTNGKRSYEMYEPFIWNEKISQSRKLL